jgi:hypothetical protein
MVNMKNLHVQAHPIEIVNHAEKNVEMMNTKKHHAQLHQAENVNHVLVALVTHTRKVRVVYLQILYVYLVLNVAKENMYWGHAQMKQILYVEHVITNVKIINFKLHRVMKIQISHVKIAVVRVQMDFINLNHATVRPIEHAQRVHLHATKVIIKYQNVQVIQI